MILKPVLGEILQLNFRDHPRYRGCIGHWILAENGGLTTYDISGKRNNGTLNGPSWSSQGQMGSALDFEKDESDYLSCPVSGGGSSDTLTISCWVQLESAPTSYQSIFEDGTGRKGLLFSGATGNPLSYFWQNTADEYNGATGLGLTVGVWHFVAVVITPTAATVYLDNANWANTKTHTAKSLDVTWEFGRDSDSPAGRYFDGLADDIRLYNRALTPDEVLSLYHRPLLEIEEAHLRRRRPRLTGEAAGGPTLYSLTASPGVYTVSGTSATLLHHYELTASPGSYPVSGRTATLVAPSVIVPTEIDVDKFAFFFRNRCSNDGIYGNATISADVADGGTADNIFHKSLQRYGQFSGNDVTLTIQLRDKWRDVQAVHIIADVTPLATITASSKATASASYATRATVTLGTQDTDITALFTAGGADAPEDRLDAIIPIYSFYLNSSTQSTVDGHAWWQIRLDDPGRAATGSIRVRKIYLGPFAQFTTLPHDGTALSYIKTFEQEGGAVLRVYGSPHSRPTPLLQHIQLQAEGRTETEIANLEYDFARHGTQRPFFFALSPQQGTIQDSTNYQEKWETAYGTFASAPSIEAVSGTVSLVRIRGNIVESR